MASRALAIEGQGGTVTSLEADGVEVRNRYAEIIQKLIHLRSVEYFVIMHGFPYQEGLRRKIREAEVEAALVQQRLLEAAPMQTEPEEAQHSMPNDFWMNEADRMAAENEAARDFTPEELAVLGNIRLCLAATAEG